MKPSLLLSLMLTACATTSTIGTGSKSLCLEDGPITFSVVDDTPETVQQIRLHNAAWRAVCTGGRSETMISRKLFLRGESYG